MHRSILLTAAVLSRLSCVAAGQATHPLPGPPVTIVQAMDCGKSVAVPEGTKSFEDESSGFRFDYPAFLNLDMASLTFENPLCGRPFSFGGAIRIEVSLRTKYDEPFYGDRNGVVVESKDIKGLQWKHYLAQGSARFCTFAQDEQVCILAGDTSPQHILPEGAMEAMRTIEAGFAFTDPAKRMDAKIAALKPGELIGSLTIRRVITRAEIRRNPKKYEAGGYDTFGEVDLAGTQTVRGSIEDIGTMNSRGQFRIFPSSDNGPQLPFDIEKSLGPGFAFNYPPKLESAVKACSNDVNGDYIFLLKNLRLIVGPLSGGSEVRGELISITKER